jgi:hypothetical protein
VAKWGFDENVSKVRPRLRGGRGGAELPAENPTEPPPVRAPASAPEPAPLAEAVPAVPRRRSVLADFISGAESAPAASVIEAATPVIPAEPAPLAAAESTSAEAAPEMPAEPSAPEPDVEAPADAPGDDDWADPAAMPADGVPSAESRARRAQLKRKAAGLSVLPESPAPATSPASALESLSDLDALESAAQLATELERALEEAAEANEKLRRDLAAALDELARAAADQKRVDEKIGRLELEARERSVVVSDLIRELELLEGERDGALEQAAEGALAAEELEDRLLMADRRSAELERQLVDAQARMRRFEEAAAAQAAQRAALRSELEGLRRERDTLAVRNATLEREAEELGRSRRALDEVHRALSDARLRAQRIRPR